VDDRLLEEIDLLTEVITGVATFSCHLSQCQVDAILGVPCNTPGSSDRLDPNPQAHHPPKGRTRTTG
jgi:hypothetical protein